MKKLMGGGVLRWQKRGGGDNRGKRGGRIRGLRTDSKRGGGEK